MALIFNGFNISQLRPIRNAVNFLKFTAHFLKILLIMTRLRYERYLWTLT